MPKFTNEQIAKFNEDGFVIVENLFDEEEMDLLLTIAKADKAMVDGAIERLDGEGNVTRLALRNEIGDDLYSTIAAGERIVRPMEQVLGGEVYHYHHKMALKEPRTGGAWEWHQDYGYWYDNGCLFPYMASCLIAVDEATRENGCLQVLRGSHHMGRMNHITVGEQTGADPERVAEAEKQMELLYCEMKPGTAVFFHGNTLHRSDANKSENPRWSLICCYNAARNNPYKEHHHPCYTPLAVQADARVKEVGQKELSALA